MLRYVSLCALLLATVSAKLAIFPPLFIPHGWMKQCPVFDQLIGDPVNNPMDQYGVPCVPKGKAGKPVRSGLKICFEWDFVVVGAGSAGSVVASRLSEGGKYSVLLLEPGQPESFMSDIPMAAADLQNSPYDWGYRGEPIPGRFGAFKNGSTLWSRGKGVGGSSLINLMLYTRGHVNDWNRIQAAGNPGWSWSNVLPYFMKLEKSDLGTISENSQIHNKNGMLSIQYPRYRSRLGDIFMEAGVELGKKVDDYNDGHPRGFSYAQTHTKDGHRASVARAYLLPFVKRRQNLDIFYNSTVTKLNIVNGVATSVNYVNGGKTYTAKARKEVILSAGAIDSPKILMLSGIGPAAHLKEIGIPLIKDLKVGETMLDHAVYTSLGFTFNTTGINIEESKLMDYLNEWLQFGTGPMSMVSAMDVLAYIQTNASTDPVGVPDIELIFVSVGMGNLTASHFDMEDDFIRSVWGEDFTKPCFGIFPLLLQQKSKGYLKLKNKNYESQPILYYDYFSDRRDIKAMTEGIRYAIRMTETQAFKKIGAKLIDRPLPMCATKPFGSDDYWECAVKAASMTAAHQVATCKMGPKTDPSAVVDHRLRVHGISNLRVCDASIIPSVVTAHTNAPTVMVGEKCADMIKATYG